MDCTSHLWETAGITASNFTRCTCLTYGWSAICCGTPAITLEILWTCIQTVWREILQDHTQALSNSMPHHLEALIAVHGGFTSYWNLTVTDHLECGKFNYLYIVMYLIFCRNFILVTCILLGVSFLQTLVYILVNFIC